MAHYRITIKNGKGAVKHLIVASVPLNKEQVERLSLGIAIRIAKPNKKMLIEAQNMETGAIVFNVIKDEVCL